MSDQIDKRAASGILYALLKALDKIAGASAPAVMRQAGPDMLSEFAKLGIDFSCVDNLEKLEQKLGATVVDTGLCDAITFSMEGDNLVTQVTNCSFWDLTQALKSEGIPPFGCPFAGLTVALAEKNLGMRARVKTIEPQPGGKPGDTRIVVELHK